MADKKKSNERSGGVNIGSGAIKKGRSGGVNIGSGAKVKVGGEIVQQDKIVRANVVHSDVLAKLFATIYKDILNRAEDPDVDKEEIWETVQKVEKEAAKGEEANPKKVERWLTSVARMAPDILDVVIATLINPAAGVAEAIHKVAKKAKAEAS